LPALPYFMITQKKVELAADTYATVLSRTVIFLDFGYLRIPLWMPQPKVPARHVDAFRHGGKVHKVRFIPKKQEYAFITRRRVLDPVNDLTEYKGLTGQSRRVG